MSYYGAPLVFPTDFGSATPKASVASKTPTGGPFPQCNHYTFGPRLPPMLGGFCEGPRGTRLTHYWLSQRISDLRHPRPALPPKLPRGALFLSWTVAPVLPRFPRLHGKPSGFLTHPPSVSHGLRVADLPRANRKSSGIVRTLRTLSGLINTIEQKASGGRGQLGVSEWSV